jgi:hypothetical protein
MGSKRSQDVDITSVHHFTVKKTDKESTVLEEKIESITLKSNPPLPAELSQLGSLKGSTLTVTLDPSGKVAKLEGYDQMIRSAIPAGNEQIALMIRAVMSEPTFKQALDEIFNFLPTKPVNKSDTWKREGTVPLGPFGTFTTEFVYSYQGKGKDGEEIGVKPALTYAAPKGDNQLPFRINKGEFKIESAQGTIVFDSKLGKLVRQDLAFTARGALSVEAVNKETALALQLEQKLQTRLTEKPTSK